MSADNAKSQIPEDTMGEPKLPECDDLEITPEMIAAGGRVLQDQCDLIMETATTIACGVFLEMIETQRQSGQRQQSRDRQSR